MLVIQCHQCSRPAQRASMTYSPADMTRKFKVWCHGETDECALTEDFMAQPEFRIGDFTAVAFTTPRIETTKSPDAEAPGR